MWDMREMKHKTLFCSLHTSRSLASSLLPIIYATRFRDGRYNYMLGSLTLIWASSDVQDPRVVIGTAETKLPIQLLMEWIHTSR